jgi:hypothetical protein
MSEVTGKGLKQICGALGGAYTDTSLKRLLVFEFDRHLDEITKSGSFDDRIFDLVTAADSEGWLIDLLRAARADKPNAPALLQCEAIDKLLSPSPTDGTTFRSATSNNLPRLQRFFGREKELETIRRAWTPSRAPGAR